MTILDMRVPREAADWLDAHEWVQADGDGVTTGCLHTALLRPCQSPGDNVLWHHLMRYRSYTEAWNDTPGRQKSEVTTVAREATEPTEAEMAAMLGPQWLAICDLVRRAAVLTVDEVRELATAVVAAMMEAAWDAAWDAAPGAARGAALDAARDASRDASPDASRAAARDASQALVVRDLIGLHGFTADHYRTLTRSWVTVIGPCHPDDPKDGLA